MKMFSRKGTVSSSHQRLHGEDRGAWLPAYLAAAELPFWIVRGTTVPVPHLAVTFILMDCTPLCKCLRNLPGARSIPGCEEGRVDFWHTEASTVEPLVACVGRVMQVLLAGSSLHRTPREGRVAGVKGSLGESMQHWIMGQAS